MNKRHFLLLLIYIFLLLTMSACKKIDDMGYRIFTIKENKHRSTTTYNTTKSNFISFDVIF